MSEDSIQATTVKDESSGGSPDLLDNLKEFARAVIEDTCWGYGSLDGGDVQSTAERLGLIYQTDATQADVESTECELGERIYRLSPSLRRSGDRKPE